MVRTALGAGDGFSYGIPNCQIMAEYWANLPSDRGRSGFHWLGMSKPHSTLSILLLKVKLQAGFSGVESTNALCCGRSAREAHESVDFGNTNLAVLPWP